MSLEEFVALVKKEGVAKPNRFKVTIAPPLSLAPYLDFATYGRRLSFYCESANFPARNIGVRQQRITGPNYQRPFNVDYGGEGMTMTFNLDRDMKVKAFFDAWMSKIIDPLQYFVYRQGEYISNRITIEQLDEKNNFTYGIFLEDAFPRSISLLDLNQSSQNQVHKLNVTFAYRRWIPIHDLTNRIPYPAVEPVQKIVERGQFGIKTGKERPTYLDDWYNTQLKSKYDPETDGFIFTPN